MRLVIAVANVDALIHQMAKNVFKEKKNARWWKYFQPVLDSKHLVRGNLPFVAFKCSPARAFLSSGPEVNLDNTQCLTWTRTRTIQSISPLYSLHTNVKEGLK